MNDLRHRIATVLVSVVLAATMGIPTVLGAFPDAQGTPYDVAFSYLQERGVIAGYADGGAHPFVALNRAEAIKILLGARGTSLARVAWYRQQMPPLPLFEDVTQTAWYAPYLEVAFEQGLVHGYPDRTFRAGRPLSVEEAVVLLMRTYGSEAQGGIASTSAIIENHDGQWYTSAVNTAIERNLLLPSTRLRLGQAITRADFAEMVYRRMRLDDLGVAVFPEESPQALISATAQQPAQTMQPRSTTPSTSTRVQPLQRITVPQQQATTIRVGQAADHPEGSEKHFAISMPSLGIADLTVTHPVDPFTPSGVLNPLKQGVGHLFSYPGGGGKIMIYGHSSGYAWDVSEFTKIFRRVNELNTGDRIYVTYDGQLHEYEVTSEEAVPAQDTSRFDDDGSGEELILYTCWPPDSIAQRYLVHARPVSSIAAR